MTDEAIIELLIIVLVMIVIIIGNLTMCICILKTKSLHSPSGYIVASLATADLLVGIWLLPFSIPAVTNRKWTLGPIFCNVNGYTNHVLCTASMLNLFAVSVDRYIAIMHPLRYEEHMTTRRAMMLIIMAWLYGFLTALFPLFGWARYIFSPGIWLCTTDFKVSYSFSYFIIITVFVMPLSFMSIIYYKIFQVAYRHMVCIRQQEKTRYGSNQDKKLNETATENVWKKDSRANKLPDRLKEDSCNTCKRQRTTIASSTWVTKTNRSNYINEEGNACLENNKENKRKKLTFKKELRTGLVLFVIVIIFVISWTPFAILNLICLHTKRRPSLIEEAIVSRLAYLNSAVNPPLYCMMNKAIRLAVKKSWISILAMCNPDRICNNKIDPLDETQFQNRVTPINNK